MAALVHLPRSSDAFSRLRPSTNAHVDVINPTGGRDRGLNVVRLPVIYDPASPCESDPDPAAELETATECINLILTDPSARLPLTPPQLVAHVRSLCRRTSPALAGAAPARRLQDAIAAALAAAVTRIERESRSAIMAREAGWLRLLVGKWEAYALRARTLVALFVYLDRTYAAEGSGVRTIWDVTLQKFREGVWNNPLILNKTRTEMLAIATAARSASLDIPDLAAAVEVGELAKELDTLATLTDPWLDAVREHYDATASAKLAQIADGSLTASAYVNWAVSQASTEARCADLVLSAEVATQAVEIVWHETAELTAAEVVPKAMKQAMDSADLAALATLHRFCTTGKAPKLFCKSFRDYIQDRVRTVISDPAKDPQMIDSTLELKRFLDTVVTELCTPRPLSPPEAPEVEADYYGPDEARVTAQMQNRRLELEDAARAGLKAGIGSRHNAPAEWIAKYIDTTMRRGPGAGTEEAFDALLDELIALIGFMPDKDVFRAFYTSSLAKRLLLSKSASDDMERTMIIKLQKEMGDEFTSGDVMMKDLQLSETLIKSYQSAKAKNPESFKDRFDFTAHVLTESAWPSYPLLKDGWDFKLSPELQSSLDSFTSWYATQHQNRKLSWRHQLSTVTMIARFDSGRYEIGLSLFQAMVLLQFNEVDVLDFTEIKAGTGIESSELVRTLQSLALGRKGTRVLLKRPAGKAVEPTDKFAFNKAFSSDKHKFRINQIQQELSAEESRKTNEQVAIDRVSVLEATIVRIMKSRKALTLQLLIDAVVTDVSKRFPPDVKEIKKRVESLIEREYLQRDAEDRNKLTYLA